MELRIRSGSRARGFTLVELIVVLTIVSILATISVPLYYKSVRRTKESVLRSNLFAMRNVIDEYSYDKAKAPQSLEDLVREGYLRQVPEDPITGRNDTWQIAMEDGMTAVSPNEPGIFNVYSGSSDVALDGTRYSDWGKQ